MSENQVRKIKTRCYYTDYVNHAVRFYLTTPETLHTEGKRKADILNWMAVQSVFHMLKDDDRNMLTDVYKTHHRLTEGVRIYCEKNSTDEESRKRLEKRVWILVTKASAAIARKRGLV